MFLQIKFTYPGNHCDQPELSVILALSLIVVTLPSADNLCKQFGPWIQTFWQSESVPEKYFQKKIVLKKVGDNNRVKNSVMFFIDC